ncbi:hypothetical protein ACSBR2_033041 [Camellia fascicularis]
MAWKHKEFFSLGSTRHKQIIGKNKGEGIWILDVFGSTMGKTLKDNHYINGHFPTLTQQASQSYMKRPYRYFD